jgi:WD40 repeat protein
MSHTLIVRLLAFATALVVCDWMATRSSIAAEPTPSPSLDLYGDPLPTGAVARLGTARLEPKNGTWAVALSPDGKTLATGSMPGADNGVVEIWDADTGRKTSQLFGDANNILSLALSPDGGQVAVGHDYRLELWDARNRKKLANLPYDDDPKSGVWVLRPIEGWQRLAGITRTTLRIWDLGTGNVLQTRKYDCNLEGLTVSADGSLFATSGKGFCDIGTVEGLNVTRRIKTEGMVRSVAFAPDAKSVAGCVLVDEDQYLWRVLVWNAETGTEIGRSGDFIGWPWDLDFASDGKIVIAGKDSLVFWSPPSGELQLLRKPSRSSWYLSMSVDRKRVATAGYRAEVWDTSTGNPITERPAHAGVSRGLFFSADGRTLTTSADATIRTWDVESGRQLSSIQWDNEICAMARSPDERMVAVYSADGRATVASPSGDARRVIFAGPACGRESIQVAGLAFSPDGKTLAASAWDNHARLWNVADGKLMADQVFDSQIVQAGFSSDGRNLLVAPLSQNIQFSDGRSLRWLGQIPESKGIFSGSFALAPDAKSIAVRGAGRVRDAPATPKAFDIVTPSGMPPLRVLRWPDRSLVWESKPSPEWLSGLAFSPDGTRVASSWGRSDALRSNIRIWSASTGQLLREIPVDEPGAARLAFSPDGKLLGTASDNGAVLIWNVSVPSAADAP